MECRAGVEACAEDTRDKRIAYHQLKAYLEYLSKGETPVEADGYNRILVSVVFACLSFHSKYLTLFFSSIGAIQP